MKIFYYFRELNTPMFWWQRTQFFDELKRAGFADFVTYNPLDYRTVEEANENVTAAIRKEGKVDIFLTCVDSTWISADTINKVKQMGIPTILVCWDNLELPYKHKSIARLFDLVWITSLETKYLFERWGCTNIVFQTYAANPFIHNPNWSKSYHSVGFIGSPYGSRVNKINDIISSKTKCSVYSDSLFEKNHNNSKISNKIDLRDIATKMIRYTKFPIGRKVLFSTVLNKFASKSKLNTTSPFLIKNPSVSDDDMYRLYSEFSLSLNITELRDTYILSNPIHKIHLRAFEIPMCGGLQLAAYTDELAGYFEDGKEIVLYKSTSEMVDKCKFYLNSDQDSLVIKMKKLARARAEKEHTWLNRFSKVINSL